MFVVVQPSFETEQEMAHKRRQDELAAKAALWWDPLRVIEEEQKRLLKVGLDAINSKKASSRHMLPATGAS